LRAVVAELAERGTPASFIGNCGGADRRLKATRPSAKPSSRSHDGRRDPNLGPTNVPNPGECRLRRRSNWTRTVSIPPSSWGALWQRLAKIGRRGCPLPNGTNGAPYHWVRPPSLSPSMTRAACTASAPTDSYLTIGTVAWTDTKVGVAA
jgi:hypothetical protein